MTDEADRKSGICLDGSPPSALERLQHLTSIVVVLTLSPNPSEAMFETWMRAGDDLRYGIRVQQER